MSPSRIFLAVAGLIAFISAAAAQVAHTSYSNLTTATTTNLKNGAGVLTIICVNNPTAATTITVFDSTIATASGVKIGTITLFASTNPCFPYNVNFLTGLTIAVSPSAVDLTVGYQ